jgi:hypothetical protein
MRALVAFVILFEIASPISAHARGGDILIDDGKRLYESRQKPSELRVREWQIRLNKRSTPTEWGRITGKTIDSVQKQLKESQDFEKRYERWCECGPDEDTFFRPSKPIAVLERETPSPTVEAAESVLSAANVASEQYERDLRRAIDAWKAAESGKSGKLFRKPGDVLREYARGLRATQKRLAQAQRQISDMANTAASDLGDELNDLTNELQELRKTAESSATTREALPDDIKSALGMSTTDKTPNASNALFDRDWTRNGFHLVSDELLESSTRRLAKYEGVWTSGTKQMEIRESVDGRVNVWAIFRLSGGEKQRSVSTWVDKYDVQVWQLYDWTRTDTKEEPVTAVGWRQGKVLFVRRDLECTYNDRGEWRSVPVGYCWQGLDPSTVPDSPRVDAPLIPKAPSELVELGLVH